MYRIAKICLCSLIVILSLVISSLYFELETKALNAEELPNNTLEVFIENFSTPFKPFTPEKTEQYNVPPYHTTIYYPPPLSTPSPTPTILPISEPYNVPPYHTTIYYPPPLSTPSPTPTIPPIYTIKKRLYAQTSVDKVPYDTHCEQEKLLELKGKKMVLILYEYNNSLLKRSEDIAPSTSQIILDRQKNKFLSEFDSLFKIEDVSNNSQVLQECSSISKILQKVDADGGILITNDYGYRMSGTPFQVIWEKILPWFKELIRVGFMSNVEDYYFASNTYIVDKEGSVVWNFYGKVSASPEVEYTIGEFAEYYIGGAPSEQKIIKAMIPITDNYTEYIRWLVEMDFNGMLNKSYSDYPRRVKGISISPASDYHYSPYVYDAPQCQYELSTPAFEVVFAIAGLLVVAYLLRRRG